MPRSPLIDEHGEVRELTLEDMRRMRPAREVLPADVYATLTKKGVGKRGRQKAPTKTMVSIRLDEEIVAHYKSQGSGWQKRINDALKHEMGSRL